MSDLRSLVQKLRDEGYIIIDIYKKYQFTDKFYQDLDKKDTSTEVGGPVFDLVKIENRIAELKEMTPMAWQLMFSNFILEAQVPRVLEDNRGQTYYANKSSDAGLKAFKKALQGGAVYEVLVKSTMLYYKSSVKYKKAVGNYFAQGDWRSDYEALISSAQDGSLETHIKIEVQNNGITGYSIG